MSDEVIGTGPLPNVYIDNVSIRTNCVIDLVMNDFTEDSLWYNSQILADMQVVICVASFDNIGTSPDNIIAQKIVQDLNAGEITINEVEPLQYYVYKSSFLCNSAQLGQSFNSMNDYMFRLIPPDPGLKDRDNIVVYAMVTYDLNNLNLPVEYKYLDGPVASEIAKGEDELVSYAFYLPDGSLYSGPYHQHTNGQYMVGPVHVEADHPTLTRRIVINYTNTSDVIL
tara:strand:- start:8505 stop:9182 length:678 start_codon:yes stop_codon:yes gene_type:complete